MGTQVSSVVAGGRESRVEMYKFGCRSKQLRQRFDEDLYWVKRGQGVGVGVFGW